jgi:hypothetical protein
MSLATLPVDPTAHVFGAGDLFEVVRVYTGPIATEVV